MTLKKFFSSLPGIRLARNYYVYKKRSEYYEKQASYFQKKYYKVNHLYLHFKTQFAPGHFYSPYPDLKDIESRSSVIFERKKQDLSGIDMRESEQLKLLGSLAEHYKQLPYVGKPSKKHRYYFDNPAYSYTDGVMLFCMLLHFKPKRIIEIGSGYSSALTLDVKDLFLKDLDITFIEPYPELLLSLTKKTDSGKYHLIDEPLYKADPAIFGNLQKGDFLFIDSTHVAKPGSDVNQIYFQILPKLKPGVIIHIHDMFYPFEYPKSWIKETRAWNEDYIVRAFLYNNKDYQMLMFNNFMNLHHKEALKNLMPLTLKNAGGSLWLKKVK